MDIFDTIDDFAIEEEYQFLNYINPPERKVRVLRKRVDHYNTWDDKEFWRRFRLKKDTVAYLLLLIEDKIKHKTLRGILTHCNETMRSCCVPGCDVRVPLHSVPFSSGLRWKQWLKMCPFLQKYSIRRLNDLKICRKHFIPEHIDHEKGKLTKDSFPLLHLPPLEPKILGIGNILEISPMQSNGSINLRINASTPSLHGQSYTSLCTSCNKNNLHETCLVYLKAEDKLGLPVDHNMYCMPSQTAERPEFQNVISHMSSKEILSRDCTIGSIEAEQGTCMAANHYKYCPLQDVNAGLPASQDRKTAEFLSSTVKLQLYTEPNVENMVNIVDPQLWTHTKEQRMTGEVRVTTQANKAAQHNNMNNEQLIISIEHSPNQCLLEDDYAYVLPTNTVSNESAQTYKQPSIYLSPNVLNQLRSKSSKHALFADEMEPVNQPICHVTEFSQIRKFNLEIPSVEPNNPLQFDRQSIVMKPLTSVVQPLYRKLKKQTLKSLVAESLNLEETADLQPSPVVILTEKPVCQGNPKVAPNPPVQAPLIHSTEIRRMCLNKQKSTPNELMLRMQNVKLAKKIKSVNSKCKRIKSKIESAMNIAKQFIKGYPLLSREAKALIDTQLRLVVAKTIKYNEEEKLFALKLHQLSPECYRFLQRYLKLPSKNTIQNIAKNP